MSRRDPMVAVQQMRDHGKEAMELADGRSRVDLDLDRMLELSLTRLMEIIGEAARRVPDDFRAQYPNVPWRQTTDFRNVLIQDDDTVDFDVLWQIIQERLPPLVDQLQAIIDENIPAK
ncbi:MAG: DUF86 domain-containing protein [Chloroflexi bacterium]|nr:DUF86 domain-containing protein [Chloroflexota bacterium]